MKKVFKKLVPGLIASLTGVAIICLSSVKVQAETYTGTEDTIFVSGNTTEESYYIPANINYEYTTSVPNGPSICSMSYIQNGLYTFHLDFLPVYDSSRYGTVTYDFVLEGLRYTGTSPIEAVDDLNIVAFIPLTSGVPVGSEDNSSENTDSSDEGDVIPSSSNEGTDFVKLMYQNIDNTVNEIGLASQGLNADGSANPTKTIFYTASSVNKSIVKAVMKADGVTFFVTYEYEGYVFCSAITPEYANAMYREDIEWYGPAYIAKYCPTLMVGAAE